MIDKTHGMSSVILSLFQQLLLAMMRNMVTTFGLRTLLSLLKVLFICSEKLKKHHDIMIQPTLFLRFILERYSPV